MLRSSKHVAPSARSSPAGRAVRCTAFPFALKDLIDTAGVPTTGQSRIARDRVPDADAALTTRLYDAGAVLLGKLALHEFAHGGPSLDLPWPPARNPWNPLHFAGSSSSGSGAAVAAGFVPAAVGTDTGGSIRIPAGLCGIAGLKQMELLYTAAPPALAMARRIRTDYDWALEPASTFALDVN